MQTLSHLYPDSTFYQNNLALLYMLARPLEQTKAYCQERIAAGNPAGVFHFQLFYIAFIEGDIPAIRREIEWSKGTPGEHRWLNGQAAAAAFSGKLNESRRLNQQAVDLAIQDNRKTDAAIFRKDEGWIEGLFGNKRLARQKTAEALKLSENVQTDAAFTMARSGDIDSALEIASKLAASRPKATKLNRHTIPGILAFIEIHRSNPAKAIELLREAPRYELGTPAWRVVTARAEAYLLMGKGQEAASEYQKIISHRVSHPLSPSWSFAHLGLGRALNLAGDVDGSRQAYEKFFELWKDADPDIPILLEAKKEYAEMQQQNFPDN
jgi:tetratricopeptide (TPR) repeat protein